VSACLHGAALFGFLSANTNNTMNLFSKSLSFKGVGAVGSKLTLCGPSLCVHFTLYLLTDDFNHHFRFSTVLGKQKLSVQNKQFLLEERKRMTANDYLVFPSQFTDGPGTPSRRKLYHNCI
jgi:hypothetical protein